MSIVESLFVWLLQAALAALAAPAIAGFTRTLEAQLEARRGAPLLQSWRDLARLWRKEAVVAENASAVSSFAPLAAAAATATAVLLIPSFALGAVTAPIADVITVAALLVFARAALIFAALDAGTWQPGPAVSRQFLAALIAESALLLILFAIARLAGGTSLDHIASAHFRAGFPFLLALAAFVILAAAPDTLTRPLAGELSGRTLALFEVTWQLRRFAWLALLIAIFCPAGMAPAGDPLDWPLGVLSFAAKLVLLAGGLTLARAGDGQARFAQAPERLTLAVILAFLSVLFVLA